MKTHNFCMFMLTALFCGALFCVPANAKVCFVGDEECGAGSDFSPMTPPDTSGQCAQEGYTTEASACTNIGAVCPYDASYVKCCSAEYAYQACVYPLETVTKTVAGKQVVDKCGSLYNCQCNSDYKTPEQWNVATKKCQPGGGICLKTNDDTVYYNKCVCDVNYFPYVGSECPSEMTLVESCTDSDGITRVSCQCPSNYRTCAYGGAAGAKSCKQGGLILYSSCKSAEDECTNAGYYKDCQNQTCYYDTNSTIKDKGSYPANCEDSYEACPYAYGFYKCRWSAANYCAKWDMTEYSKTLPSTCTKDGVQGTVIPCNLGGSYNGGGSTKNYLGYYRCKLTCEQQARGAVSQGYLTVNNNIVDIKGNYGFVRTDAAGKHLYLVANVGRPKSSINSNMNWSNAAMAGENYASINGINALYDVDPKRYSSCEENRYSSYRPTLYFDNARIQAENDFLDVDLSDINIKFVMNGGSEDLKERYNINNSHTWKNVSVLTTYSNSGLSAVGITSSGSLPTSSHRKTWADVVYAEERNLIKIKNKAELTFTGDIQFDLGIGCYGDDKNNLNNQNGCKSYTNFYMDGGATIIFEDANISSEYADDWDGAKEATMVFINSRGTMGKIWSQWNVGLSGSDISASIIFQQGFNNRGAKRRLGGYIYGNPNCESKTPGVYLTNSTLRLGRGKKWASQIRNDSDYGKLYISPDSKVILDGPLWLGPGSSVCIPNGGGTTWATSSKGGYRLEKATGGAVTPYKGSVSGYANFYYYGAGDRWTCMPGGVGVCDYATYQRSTSLGNVGNGGNWRGVSEWNPGWGGPEKSLLMPACYNMEICGMKY